MKNRLFHLALVIASMAGGIGLRGQDTGDAVLVRIEDDTQQVRVEAMDTETGRWMAIASGYRDAVDTGWLKIALPEGYEQASLRVMASSGKSPFAGKIRNSMTASEDLVDSPTSPRWNSLAGPEAIDDTASKGGGPVIEEADIWAWDHSTLYFYNQYRGLQVIDMSNPDEPRWMDYFRYPAKGEDLYSVGNGRIILIGTGSYWQGEKVTLQFLDFDGSSLSHADSVQLGSGAYMDSRRYNDYLYVMTREWIQETNPEGQLSSAPLIRLYTVALNGEGEDRIVDVQSFEGDGYLDAVLTAQPDGILLSLNKWHPVSTDWRYRWRSEVHVLVPGENGIPELVGVAPLAGVLHDKFKLNFRDGRLTTISQQADWTTGRFSRATKLENFILGEAGFVRSGSLDLAPGETLFATRFYGDTVYIVTFLFVDPLFAIDNSNPASPVIAGELEVPGWSNYIEWVDDQLFAIGIEESRLTVSIFDVADPANMSLKDRVYLNEDSWAYSEAQYDDQAISFFPGAGLLILPFTTYSWTNPDGPVQAMQLISWDDTGLRLRGQIQHIDVPRRGVLMDNTVVTISGREVVTTDVTDPDVPVEGGSATLAWNIQHLIPHTDYWLQLESPESVYTYWYWRSPYDPALMGDPVLYVTAKATPNIPEVEVPLASGRLLGVAHQDNRLVTLQDISGSPETNYWEIPEKQSLVVRVYDISDPLAPAMLDEAQLTDVEYLGGRFEGRFLPDGSVLWNSRYSPNPYLYMIDIAFWPGPMYHPDAHSYLVASITPEGGAAIPAYAAFKDGSHYWNHQSGWFWEPPYLISSLTTYEEIQVPEERVEYKREARLLAFDFSDPADPLQVADVALPGDLVAVEQMEDGVNHFLYFEPQWNVLEVWGWDLASAFLLFRQELYPPDDPDTADEYYTYSHSYAWMPPFHLRSRYEYTDGTSKNHLEVWLHEREENLFERIEQFSMENRWLSSKAVKEPFYLQSTYDQIQIYEADAWAGTFTPYVELDLPFPNIYSMNLDGAVMEETALHVPAGIYGVDTLTWETIWPEVPASTGYRPLEEPALSGWTELDSARWQRVAQAGSDAAGAMQRMQWLYHADSLPEIDPQATDAGDLWRDSSWFGWYMHHAARPGWISHLEHGPLFAYVGEDSDILGFYVYDRELGFLWTRHATYPHLYSFTRNQWLYYLNGSGLGGTRWFYEYGSGWFSP